MTNHRSVQQKFVNYLASGAVVSALTFSGQSGRTVTAAGGDIVATSSTSVTRSPVGTAAGKGAAALAAATTYNVTSTYTVSETVLGVTVTKLVQRFKYVTGNNVVLSVQACTGAVTNYNFVVSISSNVSFYMLAGGEAECDIIWQGYIVYKGFGVELDKQQTMIVNGPGIVSEYLVDI